MGIYLPHPGRELVFLGWGWGAVTVTHLLNEFFSSCKARQLEAKRKATTSRPGLPSTAARACGGEQPTLPKIGSGITLLPRENLRSMDLCWDQSCHVNVMGTGENRGWEPFLRMGAVSRTPPLALWRKRSRASLSPNHKSQTPGSPQVPSLLSLALFPLSSKIRAFPPRVGDDTLYQSGL